MLYLLLAAQIIGASPESFSVIMLECKVSSGVLHESIHEVRTIDAPQTVARCVRKKKSIQCDWDVEGKKDKISYNVDIDSPPYIWASGQNGGDVLVYNRKVRSAVTLTRVTDMKVFVGSRVCSGMFVSQAEIDSHK